MKVLVTGANGFIGRYLVSALLCSGHDVVPAVRRPKALNSFLALDAAIAVDFNRDTDPAIWLPRLTGIDAVINCAGVLQGNARQNIDAIHHHTPAALFRACETAGVKRVIQISAISAAAKAGTNYAASKKSADDFLKTTPLNWTVVKPSLVYAPGAYGGTALLRALTSMPLATPIVGDGSQTFRPVFISDLCALLVSMLHERSEEKATLVVVGPEELTLKQIVTDLREWLGFSTRPTVQVPKTFVRFVSRIGNIVGGPINTTAYKQLEFGNSGASLEPDEQLRTTETTWRKGLGQFPSQPQDRWHARLYFLRPLLRAVLGLTWILSGVIGLLQPVEQVQTILNSLGLTTGMALVTLVGSCLLDIVIGLAVLLRYSPALMAYVQIAVVLGYTVGLSIAIPALWADPFGPLLKNPVFLMAVIVLAAIEQDR